jgi:Holliday junction resolvase
MTENDVKKAIFEYLLYNGFLVIRVNSGAARSRSEDGKRRFIRFVFWQVLGRALETAGVSDLIGCAAGQFIAIECKRPGKKHNVSDAQRRFLQAVEKAGGIAVVAEGVEDVAGIVEEIAYLEEPPE